MLSDLVILRQGRNKAGTSDVVYLSHEALINSRMAHNVTHQGVESGSGGVRASKHDQKSFGLDAVQIDTLTIVGACFEES